MVLMVSIPLILIVTGISIFTALKRQKKILDSAEIIIEENFITKKQFNTTDSRIGRTDIKTISEDSLGNIIISPDSLQKSIIIPKTVERRDELKEDLNGFKEIEPFKHTSKSKLSLALNAITIVAFIISYASETKEIVIVTGSIAVIGLIWNLRTIQTSSQVDKRTKRISWFIILPLLSIVAKIFSYLN
jgi:hypothetical protein